MKYHFSVTGIGLCVGGIAGHEDLIEAVLTQKQNDKAKAAPTLKAVLEAAVKYMEQPGIMLLTAEAVPQAILDAFAIARQQTVTGFGRMLLEAGAILERKEAENVLLLGKSEDGFAAVLLSANSRRCFAQVSIEASDGSSKGSLMADMMEFIKAVVEIRYAFKLNGSVQQHSHVWHWQEKRSSDKRVDGVAIHMEEAPLGHKAVYPSSRYLFPVKFDTVEEAKAELQTLRTDAAGLGLYASMNRTLRQMRTGKEHTIVLLAESFDALANQIDELLSLADQLLDAGFCWQNKAGSRYIRRTAKEPKVVYMNPPGGMFNSRPFHRFVSKLYEFMEGPFQPGRTIFSSKSQNEILRRYLEEINTTYAVIYLLEAIGIKPDYLSGASMGELVFDLSNLAIANGDEDLDRATDALDKAMRSVLEGRSELEMAYFGHSVDLAKFYLKCDAQKAKQALAKYRDVFVIIEGSPKDLLICGERASCLKLIQELGCIPIELEDPIYVHTPVVEREYEKIRSEVLRFGMYLDVDGLPYRLFSSHLKKNMDSTSQMFAENFASIISKPVDYTEAVKTLYAQGARVFIDLSTTQLCGGWAKTTLSGHPDAEVISIYEEKGTADYLLDLCAAMLAGNVDFDFDKLYSRLTFGDDSPVQPTEKKAAAPEVSLPAQRTSEVKPMSPQLNAGPARADAQALLQQYAANQMAINQRAYELFLDAENKLFAQFMAAQTTAKPAAEPEKNYLWDREQVITMTDTSMAAVLGPQYAEVDKYPIRARMPLPPFLFVSRIISIDAEFGVMRPSSIVAEYDVDEDCVFRMGDTQVSPLIGSEASHIAIFLIAYMGLDAMSKGTLSYRAIDSSQVTYSERHFRVGDVMRTVLKINRFVQNGSTTLLFFTFETYNGEELIAITEATGGFFTKEDLSSNKGIIAPKKLLKKAEPKEFLHFIDSTKTSYDEELLSAFYDGNYEACFGRTDKLSLKETYYLPHDMKMIDRVTQIDYNGGMYGRGIICGEKQITPDMWPFKAHFKNDPVFPAIIMTDGITQLGVFLFAHAGLLSKYDSTNVTMINGNCVKSKFRGQARHGYSTLRYEIHVKDVVQTEDAISVYFDGNIFNDGLQIIQVESYALKIFSDPT